MTHKFLPLGLCCCALILGAAPGCKREAYVMVKADFSTDKDVYNLYDEVLLTNLSSSDGVEIDIYKWEWGDGGVSYEKVPAIAPTSDEECTLKIRLTAVASSVNVGDTLTREVRFVDGNIPPTADFNWSPTPVYIGRTLKLTDASTDDGRIVSWLWNVGGVELTEQNPTVTAAPDGKVKTPTDTKSVVGDIDPLNPPVQQADTLTVTLTVTDNGFKTGTVTKKILIYNEDE